MNFAVASWPFRFLRLLRNYVVLASYYAITIRLMQSLHGCSVSYFDIHGTYIMYFTPSAAFMKII